MELIDINSFNKPTRQSIVAIFLIIFKYIKVMLRQVWPFLLVFFVGGSGKSYGLLFTLSVISIGSMIWAIISYFKFYFHIENDELIIQKGIFNRTNLNIPFDRIQTINIKQNVIHQLLNVVELEVDTAGTKKAEFSFDALSKSKAEALRSILLKKRDSSVESESVYGDVFSDFEKEILAKQALEREQVQEEKIPILNLSIANLLKVGISQNHFRSVGFVLIGLFWIQESVEDAGIDTDSYMNTGKEFLLSASFSAILSLIFIATGLAILISLVRTVLVYFNAHLWREGIRIKLSHGLFNKKEVSAHYDKIQLLQWGHNPLQKLMKIKDVSLKQASSAAVSEKKSLRIQGCSDENIEYLKKSWLGEAALENLETHGISIHYFYRRLLYRMLFCALLIASCIVAGNYDWLILAVLLVPYFIATTWLSYKKSGYAINDQTLYVTNGVFGDDFTILPLIKIQNVKLRQTPFQSRKNLADVRIFTASGNIVIPYIPLDIAENLCNYFLYRIEVSEERWM